MQTAKLRYLTKDEDPKLPFFFRFLSEKQKERLLPLFRPFVLEEAKNNTSVPTYVLQTKQGRKISPQWKKAFSLLDTTLKDGGISILIPPYEGEWKEGSVPLAKGEKLAAFFAFDGAAEALRRQGKDPEGAHWLIAGGSPAFRAFLFSLMGNEVNRLSLFTPHPEEAAPQTKQLYQERGLVTEVFSSPKNPAFREADAVLSCGTEQLPFEYLLKRDAFWLDLAENRTVLRNLRNARPDITACEGFFFKSREIQTEGREAEAMLFLKDPVFRRLWEREFYSDETLCADIRFLIQNADLSVSGFSAFGKRVKIPKNQGKNGFHGVNH